MSISESLAKLKFYSLNEVAQISFNDFLEKTKFYSLEEKNAQVLYNTALEEQSQQRNALTRANPMLKNIPNIIYTDVSPQHEYNENFTTIKHDYAVADTPASMFSVFAYLAELYREAYGLHAKHSPYHLDKRRADLKTLALSQDNRDQEVSTLTLSNDILLQYVKEKMKEKGSTLDRKNKNDIYRFLYERKIYTNGNVNLNYYFNYHYEVIEWALKAQGTTVSRLLDNPFFAKRMIKSNLNPLLQAKNDFLFYQIVTTPKKTKYYYKLTGLSSEIIDAIIDPVSQHEQSDFEKVEKITRIKNYQARYHIPEEQAFILDNNTILITKNNNHQSPSQFDQLFNSPPLKGVRYELTGAQKRTHAPLEAQESAVLRQALAVDERELSIMCEMLTDAVVSQITYLSALYRIRLLARIHGLTISELAMLLRMLVNPSKSLTLFPIDMSDDQCAELIDKLYQRTYWLCEQGWRVDELYDMTTTEYNGVKTLEIETLIQTVAMGLSSALAQENPETTIQVSEQIAPFFLSSLALPSITVANFLLAWLDKLIPHANPSSLIINVNTFRNEIIKWNRDHLEINEKMIIFCQRLQQLAHIYHRLQLSEPELSLLVEQPHLLDASLTLIGHSIAHLELLTRIHSQIISLGDQVPQVLIALKQRNLTAAILAPMIQMDKETLQQAAKQVDIQRAERAEREVSLLDQTLGAVESTKTEAKKLAADLRKIADSHEDMRFSDFSSITNTLEWLTMAQELGIKTDDLRKLLRLSNVAYFADYPDWQAVSTALLAGQDAQQSRKIALELDKIVSRGLSHYYVASHGSQTTPPVITRDQVYQHLLIDNQVSTEVKTSKIAAAIAALQLYISRVLQRKEEEGLNTDVLNKPFFQNWENGNGRYSTWAAAAKLRYQPENYIDPLQRLEQSQMMDNFQQAISDAQLNNEMIEQAFKAYLTEFEQIANLSIISAYHDSVRSNEGLTYFVGENPNEKGAYYWRRIDQKQFSQGKFFVGAWSQWKKIDCAANPVAKLIRPVIYQSRLYLVWIEDQWEMAADNTDIRKQIKINKQKLKIAYLNYNGNWSSTFSFNILEEKRIKNLGLSCTEDNEKNIIAVYLYEKQDSHYSLTPEHTVGYAISENMICHVMSHESLIEYFPHVKNEFDVLNQKNKKVSYPYPGLYNYSITDNQDELISGRLKLSNDIGIIDSIESERNLFVTCESHKKNYLKLFIKPRLQFAHNYFSGYEESQHTLIGLMEKMGEVGHDNYIFYKIENKKKHQSGTKITLVICPNKCTVGIFNPYSSPDPTKNIKLYFYGRENPLFEPIIIKRGKNIFHISEFKYQSERPIQFQTPQNDIMKFNECVEIKLAEENIEFDNIFFETNFIKSSKEIKPTITDFFISMGNHHKEKTDNFFSELDSDRIVFESDEIEYIIENALFSSDIFTTTISMNFHKGAVITTKEWAIKIKRTHKADTSRLKINNDAGIQYLILNEAYREPLNTKFAKKLVSLSTRGIDAILNLETQKQEEISSKAQRDFHGANAIYFWELFYYVPMMVMKRLLQEQHFSQASRWLKYVYNPAGYAEAPTDTGALRRWNVLPLHVDEKKNNLESSGGRDPDAIAQAEPIHYRIATLMLYLDLLLERGDHAYRQLERDSLVEAKMWYMQALDLLGEKPVLKAFIWNEETTLKQASLVTDTEEDYSLPQGASLTVIPGEQLFLPEENTKFRRYWRIFEHRLYNLRHNLTLDGAQLSLPFYATPPDPRTLHSASLSSLQGIVSLPTQSVERPMLQRFPQMLDHAREMVLQLMQFGSTLLNVIERKDAEALNELLQTQALALMTTSIQLQDKTREELQQDLTALNLSVAGATARYKHYDELYEENINPGEQSVMDLSADASSVMTVAQGFNTTAAVLDMAPNLFGASNGGCKWDGLARGMVLSAEIVAARLRVAADKTSQFEMYCRRREEWDLQRKSAQSEIDQLTAQINGTEIRIQSADKQKEYLEAQQKQIQEQLLFLQSKFSNQKLYHWLRGQLTAIYKGFYDQTLSRCQMSERAWLWETAQEPQNFIPAGAWQGIYAGLLSGEILMLNLTQMETAYLQWDNRALEVERTVSLAQVYNQQALGENKFDLAKEIKELITNPETKTRGKDQNTLQINGKTLSASVNIHGLQISKDYPVALLPGKGLKKRLIKQISVSLPMLLGAYQDVQVTLSYQGSCQLPKGCTAIAVSRGINDHGQFQLNFNDEKYLPFEGIDIEDPGALVLRFPNATSKQKQPLQSLNDIILHIRYIICD
ncbi:MULTISPECIES: neuraminidase-like domain-containing protein [Candidatus Fukatsuia]|uniref:Tc toxin subunit A-related protein n=1 Tax=Candidatus Fukatsuia TaxID=1927833 RepID=UPI000933E574|nr:neuraminidase-like domain-containing protein [Candidatus Fukatsuia symbiotica]